MVTYAVRYTRDTSFGGKPKQWIKWADTHAGAKAIVHKAFKSEKKGAIKILKMEW